MTNLAVIGPGLLGGSIALAARRAGGFRVSAWARRSGAVEQLRSQRVVDFVSGDLRAVTAEADQIVLCVPIGAMALLANEMAASIRPSALITDVGSVKTPVVRELTSIFQIRGRFVGSHPMAGSEQNGLQAARADLFDGAVCIVTPTALTAPSDVKEVGGLWETLGCRVRHLSPEAHDETVASISHFPHLLAAALVNLVHDSSPAAFDFAGPGFRDSTRVAAGPPEMWAEILRMNCPAVRNTTQAMVEKLGELLKLLDRLPENGETQLYDFLSKAKSRRDRVLP